MLPLITNFIYLSIQIHKSKRSVKHSRGDGPSLLCWCSSHKPSFPPPYLQVCLVLNELLGAAVEQADVRVALFDGLSAELQHQPQHAVSRRMLRPKVDGQVGHVLLCRRIFVWKGSKHTG